MMSITFKKRSLIIIIISFRFDLNRLYMIKSNLIYIFQKNLIKFVIILIRKNVNHIGLVNLFSYITFMLKIIKVL